MSTLTTTTDALVPAASHTKSTRKPFWRGVFNSIIESRQRRAEREIAAYIESRGGLLNDELEREIMRRASGRPITFRM